MSARLTFTRVLTFAALTLTLTAQVSLAPPAKKSDLHIPQGRRVNFTTYLQDGGGMRWDIQSGLNVGSGTSSAYSGALYCQINGSNVHSQGYGWMNAAGDEIEIGPWLRNNVQVHRRVKVYKDKPLARWLDILSNNTGSPQNVPVRIYSCFNYTISQISTNTGGAAFGEKDWGFITNQQQGRPQVMHIVCGPKAKLRPTIHTSGNSLYVNYMVTVPANGTAILCYFESQNTDVGALSESMKKFRASRLLRDLSPSVRKLIVNFRPGSSPGDIDLDRSGTADSVQLKNGDSIQGKIGNPEFLLKSLHGELKLPADQVVGFLSVPGRGGQVRAVLVNGQVITGSLSEGALKLALATGGELKIPYDRIGQCTYRITKTKPEDSPFTDPLILLRNGDRLAFDPARLKCVLQTRHGPVALAGKDLVEVRLSHEANGVHRAVFLNGSTLGGLLTPDKIALPLRLGPQLDIPRDMVLGLRFAEENTDAGDLTQIQLSNEDELIGRLVDESYALATDFGDIPVRPANILGMAFSRTDPGMVAVTMWDGKTTLRGRLKQKTLRFAVEPGPELDVHIGQIVSLYCPAPLPPDKIVADVKKLVARLSSSSYKDREEAQEALIRMGRSIVPLLKKYTDDTDPEVRQRIRVVLDKLGGDRASTPMPAMPPNVFMWGAQQRGCFIGPR